MAFTSIYPNYVEGVQLIPAQPVVETDGYLLQLLYYAKANRMNKLSLNLANFQFTTQSVALVGELLQYSVGELDMSYCSQHLYAILRYAAQIKSLLLIQSYISNEFDNIFKIYFKQLKHIDISHNVITKQYIQNLLGSKSALQLTTLIMRDCGLTDDALSTISPQVVSILSKLDISRNPQLTGSSLGAMLRQCQYLRYFDCAECKVSDIKTLVNEIPDYLVQLNIATFKNKTNQLISNIALCLPKLLSLERLILRNNTIDEQQIIALMNVLVQLKNFKLLDVRNCGCGIINTSDSGIRFTIMYDH